MNVNGLSNLSDPYIQSLLSSVLTQNNSGNGASRVDSSSLTLPPESSTQLSPLARVLSTLQQLQQSDPNKYQQVTAQIATNLQNAAKTATANGNTAQANELSQLATDFTNASQNNTLPNVSDLAQALGGVHHHHHRHGAPPSSGTSASATDTTSGSTTTSSTTDSSAAESNLSQLISAFLVNSTSPAQANPLDPMSIISKTLSTAGVNRS